MEVVFGGFFGNVLSPKICVQKKGDLNAKLFNIIINENEDITKAKQISCDCKCNFSSTTCNSNQRSNNTTC